MVALPPTAAQLALISESSIAPRSSGCIKMQLRVRGSCTGCSCRHHPNFFQTPPCAGRANLSSRVRRSTIVLSSKSGQLQAYILVFLVSESDTAVEKSKTVCCVYVAETSFRTSDRLSVRCHNTNRYAKSARVCNSRRRRAQGLIT